MDINIENLKHGFEIAINNLESKSKIVDELNVFPVPDGDTGTNMTMTVKTAISMAENEENKEDFLKAFNKGVLLGARGNSGVILSQIIGGFFDVIIDNLGSVDEEILSKAFEKSTERAYKAVMDPVEGTILTVSKDMASSAKENLNKDLSLIEYIDAIYQDGLKSLDNTPNILPVLKEAGVVDAGGKGLLILVEGFKKWLSADTSVESSEMIETTTQTEEDEADDDLKYGYCTEFLITVDPQKLESIEEDLKSRFKEHGDSILVVGIDNTIKVHMHTEHPGKMLEIGLEHGQVYDIDIDNMRLQAANKNEKENKPKPSKTTKQMGIITVSVGDGFKDIFESLNVDLIIHGGQTMNPSTQEFLEGVESLDAEDIYILPNNKNIIMAVEQVVGLTDKNVYVIPTTSMPEGIQAILNLDTTKSGEENVDSAKKAITEIKTGEITFAIRDTIIDGEEIKKDQALGIYKGAIISKGTDPVIAAEEVIDSMVDEDDSFISLYYGEDVTIEQAELLEDHVSSTYTDMDVQLIPGGQPLYYYILSVE